MSFTLSQYRLLANYFSGISQGLLLASVIGQVFIPSSELVIRFLVTIGYIFLALLFLYLALLYSKKGDHES
ncbi:TPA: hypothetical protein DIS61_06205 [Patescibacteria group bacterium]|nr:hypothetical protein [Patescibacteria group bacterium]